MSICRTKIAERIHQIYKPNDLMCTYTRGDWVVAKEILQLQAELGKKDETIDEIWCVLETKKYHLAEWEKVLRQLNKLKGE